MSERAMTILAGPSRKLPDCRAHEVFEDQARRGPMPSCMARDNSLTAGPGAARVPGDVYGADASPFNTRFGNGDPIGADVVQAINKTYEAHTVCERWETGDLLLVDNILTAHAREAFEGPREIVIGMAEAVRPASS